MLRILFTYGAISFGFYFVFHFMIGNHLVLNIYGGNAIFYFLIDFIVLIIFYVNHSKNAIIFSPIVAMSTVGGQGILHFLDLSFKPQAFDGIGYLFFIWIFYCVVSYIFFGAIWLVQKIYKFKVKRQ